jgi:glycine cleavage system H lipoate-binding protein
MVVLLVILTFAVMLLIDHLLVRQPVMIAEEPVRPSDKLPRLVPSIVGGFELPANLLYHPGHTWVVAETPDLVRVGIDDFATKVAGDISTIDVPSRGQWIRQGQRVIALHHDGREIGLVSPIEGTVVDVNREALTDPAVTRNDPYGNGWLLKVNAPDSGTNFRNLLGGTLARRWMDDAAARLRAAVSLSPALAQDGGLAMDGVIDQLQDNDWQKLTRELFLT